MSAKPDLISSETWAGMTPQERAMITAIDAITTAAATIMQCKPSAGLATALVCAVGRAVERGVQIDPGSRDDFDAWSEATSDLEAIAQSVITKLAGEVAREVGN